MALITVLWVLTLLTLLAGSALAAVHTRSRSLDRTIAALEAKAERESELNRAIRLLAGSNSERNVLANSTQIADAEGCQAIDLTDAAVVASIAGRRLSLSLDKDNRALIVMTGDVRQPVWILSWSSHEMRAGGCDQEKNLLTT